MDLITLALARKYTKDQLSGVNEAVEDAQQAVIDAQTAVGQAQSTLQQIQNVAENIPDDYEHLSQTVQSMAQWGNQISKQTRNLIYDIIQGLDIDSTGKAVSSQQYALALCFVDDGGTYTVTVPDDQVVYGYFSNIPVAGMYTTDATRYTLPAGVTTITSSYTRLLAVRFTMGASADPPQIEEGTEQTKFIQPITAIDAEAREDIEDLQGSLGSIEEIRQDVESMSSNFNVITTAIEPTRNLASYTIRNAKIDDNGIIVATDEPYKISICYLPRSQTTYSVSLSGDSAWAYNTFIYGVCDGDPVQIGSQVVSVSDTQQAPAVITLDNLQQFSVPFLVVQSNVSVKVQIERGSQHTQYIDPVSAKDVIVRESLSDVREYAISNIRVTTDTEPNHTGLGTGTHTVTIYPFEEYTFGRPHYATGVNLFDVSDADSVTLNGVTVTPLSNNAFLLNGTATGTDLADFTCITKSLDDAPGVGERLQLCTYNNDQTIRITLSTVSDSGSISELRSVNSSPSSALVTNASTKGIPEGTAGLNIKFITTAGTVFDNAVVWIGVYHQTTQFTSVLNGQLPVTFESGLDTISTLYYPSVVSDVKNAQEYIDTNIDDTKVYIDDQIENVDNNLGELREDISDVKNDLSQCENAIGELEAGSLSALNTESGNVPTANGDGTWNWGSNINSIDVITKYVRYAELEIYYDCAFEYTPNGMCADDDYFYVAVISRNTVPENFEKTQIIKFSRTTYEIVAVAEGDYGHANTLCVDKDNHLLYSAQLNKYYVDENEHVQSQILTGIDVFDVSGAGITYLRTIQTDRRSAGVAFTGGQLYMYYQNGEIYTVNTQTGTLELYCTMPVVTQANTQSIEMDDQYIYWLSYTTSNTPEGANIAIYSHNGDYYGQIALDSVIHNIGYLGEYEDLYVEGDSIYLCVANVDRTEAAPYDNMRQAVVFRAYISDLMPNKAASEYSPRRQYNPQSWGSVTVYVDKNTQQYHPQINDPAHPFKSIRSAIRYLMFESDMNYLLAIAPGRYSETLKFESICGKRFRFARNGTGEVILDKQITIYDGQIEFRNITFNVTNITDGIVKIMNSFRLEPVSLSVYACKFDSDVAISDSDTVYGIYSNYPFAANVAILQDSYTENAKNIKHYLPYCKIESWQRPSDRFVKDVCNLNGGYMSHSRIDASNLDLNDFFNPGVYMITAGGSANHVPSGSNGWLIVLSQPLYGTYYHTLTKQIWLRMGTAGVTDNIIMFRTYGGESSGWGQWYRVALDGGAMPSGTSLTIGSGIFTGFITGSKKNFQVTIPLNVGIPSNLTSIIASNWSFTMRNNGVSVANININDTEKVSDYTATILPAVGVKLSLHLTDDFVTANMGSMVNNDPTIMYVQGNSAALTFTDPNAQPDTPDTPDDDGEVTPDAGDGSTSLPDQGN